MLRISGRKKLFLNVITKIVFSIVVSACSLLSIMFLNYKIVYKVSVNGEDAGYIASKIAMEKEINDYVINGDAENTAYVVMNSKVDYELMLLKKDIELKDSEILASIKNECDIYYNVYAIKVGDEEKCIVEQLEVAQSMVDSINEQQKDFTKQTDVEIIEKILPEYEIVEDVEVAIADIMKPLQKENDEIIKRRVALASSKTVSKEVLNALKDSLEELDFQKPLKEGVITSRYGWRSTGYHYGLDIAAPTGTPIYACESGIVTYSAWLRKLWIFGKSTTCWWL